MIRPTLFTLLLGAAVAVPTSELTERQASRQVNVDLYLPEITFLSLGSLPAFQQVLLSAGCGGVSDSKLSAGAATLSNIFSQSSTPLSTFIGNFIPINHQQSNNNTNYNYTTCALASSDDGTGAGAGAGSAANNDAACAGAAVVGGIYAAASSSGDFGSFAEFDLNSNASGGQNINVTAAVASGSINRVYNSVGNEDVDVGVCAASSAGAIAYASFNTTTVIPVNSTGYGTPVVHSRAQATCEAGVVDKSKAQTSASASVGNFRKRFNIGNIFGPKAIYSLSSVQAARKERGGAQALVNCNGVPQSGLQVIKYRLQINGTYTAGAGFVGTITGVREASATAVCN